MKKILINDSRLTPTMERIRDGKTQLFRERKSGDRSFVSKENADVILEHERKEMYAELIDGNWYWVNGCAQCNGLERNKIKSYIECEAHDICDECGTPRAHLKEIPWGTITGWICKSCAEEKRLEKLNKSFKKLDGRLPDCHYTENVTCPHCGTEMQSSDIYESTKIKCDICFGEMMVEVNFIRYYSTSVVGERVTLSPASAV